MRRLTVSFILLPLCSAYMAAAPWAHAETLSMHGYVSRIAEVQGRLRSSQGDLNPGEVKWLEERFPEGLEVREADGQKVQVDRAAFYRWLEKARGASEGRGWLLHYLSALKGQISTKGDPSLEDPATWTKRRALLDEIYRGHEFRHLRERKPPFWWAWVQEVLESLQRWLDKHLPSLGRIEGSWVQTVIYGIVLLLGGILVVWVARSFGFVGWRRRSLSLPDRSARRPPERDWTSWRREGEQKAHEGAFREAIRCLFVSVLMEGHQRGWWTYEPQATNNEHLRRLERGSPRYETLRRLTEVYEWVWYGLGLANEKRYRTCVDWVRRLEEAA